MSVIQNFPQIGSIDFPTELLALHPYELKTYLALKVAIASSPSAHFPSLRFIASWQEMSWDVMRLAVVNLRLHGLVLVRSDLAATLLLNEIDQLSLEFLDRPMSVPEIVQRDSGFYAFAESCLSDYVQQWVFATGLTPESAAAHQRMQDLARCVLRIRRRLEKQEMRV